jgi:S1-C subfamily serine protease
MLSPAIINVLRRSIILVLPILVLLSSGCAFRQSESVRVASFRPYAGRQIGQTDIETYLRSRVACLVSSDQDLTNRWAVGDMSTPEGAGVGCAVAIDSRGYFLTAAHCLDRRFVYLVGYEPPKTIWVRPGRVVWQGKWREGQPDIAVLHVRRPVTHTFDWADEVGNDEPVMAVGLSRSDEGFRGLAFLGGKKLGSEAGSFGSVRFAHDVPLQPGDSGGPLVDVNGRLIGINTQGTPPIVHRLLPDRVFPMVAEHPDQKWLIQTIETDVSMRKTRPNEQR